MAQAETPIQVRKHPPGPTADTDRYWFNNDPFVTHFYNAVSSMFPEGERFFIRAVRNYQARITDPKLKAQVRDFVQQEAQHFKAHDDHVALLETQGYGFLPKLNRYVNASLNWTSSRFPRFSLALTICVEHITAVFADQVLRRDDLWIEPMVPEMRKLWRWHAVEESEHKSVAFDVYTECSARNRTAALWLRRVVMIEVLGAFLFETFVRHCVLLAKDRCLTPREILRGMTIMWGKEGLLRSFHPQIWQFFRHDFHPWQHDNSHLIEASLEALSDDEFAAA